MHPLWKGSISFGLVNIPVALYSGIKRDETIHFHLLRKSDMSRVRNKRVAETDDKEVEWNEIVRGFEYEKEKYVVVTEDDLENIELKSTDVLEIAAFVDERALDPLYFSTPYLIGAEKGGEKAYHLLVDTLARTKTAGIAKIVLRSGREHLVAVMSRANRLVADALYFAGELQDMDVVSSPHSAIKNKERAIAEQLIESMKTDWNPRQYHDDYEEALKKMIAKKLSGKRTRPPGKKAGKQPSNVIDLVAILRQSLKAKEKSGKPSVHPRGRSSRIRPLHATGRKRRAA